MKRKFVSILFALVLLTGLSLIPAVPVAAADPAGCTLGADAPDTAVWSDVQKHSGDYSVKLTHTTGTRAWVEFTPPTGITLAEFVNAPDTYGFSYWRTEDKIGPQLELTFTDGNDGWVELTAEVALYDYLSDEPDLDEGQWIDKVLSATEQCHWYAANATGVSFDYSGVIVDLEDLITDIDEEAEMVGDTCADWEMTKVIVDCGWSGDTQTAYIDDVIIDAITYDLEQPAAVWVDDTDGDDANPGTETEPFLTIQHAIDILADGIVNVAAGTYAENVDVDKSLTLTGAGSATVTVNAADSRDHVFEVTASDVTISGFTASGANFLELPPIDVGDGIEISGCAGIYFALYAGVTDCNIHDNILTDNIYGILLLEPEDTVIPGNNTFTSNTATNNVISGIEMQHTCGNTFTSNTASFNHPEIETTGYGFALDSSRNNIFTGNTANANGKYGFWLKQGQGVDGSSGNTFTNNTANSNGRSGIRMTNLSGNSTYTGNTFNNNGTDVEYTGSKAGMELGGSVGDAISNLTVNNNSFSGNPTGILIRAEAIITSVVLRNNSIVGNTDFGASNLGTGTLDAKYNWWGDVAGPDTSTKTTLHNPYEEWAGNGVSDGVDYLPWLIRIDLVTDYGGWNIVSWPIMGEQPAEPPPPPEEIRAAYWFDSSTQYWNFDPLQAGALDAMYFKVTDNITFSYPVSSDATFPGVKAMKVGWNFVGLAELYDRPLNEALSDAFYGTGEAGPIGYNRVISPSLNGESWRYIREIDDPETMYPTKGYWVLMVNDGVLGGFTETPIVEVVPEP